MRGPIARADANEVASLLLSTRPAERASVHACTVRCAQSHGAWSRARNGTHSVGVTLGRRGAHGFFLGVRAGGRYHAL